MGVSATGSGKTITTAVCALEYFPEGRILVMVPTLDLIVQSAQSWRRVGHRAPMVAVCSVDKDEVLEQLGVRTTTNPIQLALWAGTGPVVVFATYASLVDREDPADVTGRRTVPGPLESALAGGERLYGQRMAPFDLAILDEGHMTAGDMGRPWAAIHDNSRIPVDFRLYLTATPRILAAPRPQRGRDGRELVIASMEEDSSTYGTRIFDLGLAEAVERSILAGFEIDVLEIRDPDPVLGLSEDALRGRRMALLQAALLEHAAQQNLHTTMVFHQRVEEAAAFAEQMPTTAAELYAAEASAAALAEAAELPASSIDAELYELEEGRHVPADRVWADWLCGDHPIAHRRAVIHRFANGIDAHNRRVHRAFLSSVRALGVGVDITGLRGAEAVCIVGSRSSQVDVVQNIGRALRPNPDGTTKTARIIIPVFLQPGEDPKDMVASASYQPLVDILQALRSHSERMVDQLASRALTRGTERRRIHVRPAPAAGPENGNMPGESSQTQQEVDRVTSVVVNFASPATPPTSPPSPAAASSAPSPSSGSRATRPWSAGVPRTGSPACTPCPMTPRPRSARRRTIPSGGGCINNEELCGPVNSILTARTSSTTPEWCGNPATKHGRRSSPRCGPTGGPPGISHPGRTLSGAKARGPGSIWPSDSSSPTSAARAASARTQNGPQSARRSWRRSTRTGTAPGPSTGSGTTASWPTWSTPTATCPTSSPACSSRATTSDDGSRGREKRAPGHNSPPNNRND